MLSDYFTLSRFERNGMIVLLLVIFIVIAINVFWPFFQPLIFKENKELALQFAGFEKKLSAGVKQAADSLKDENEKNPGVEDEQIYDEGSKCFYFDPNKASNEEWVKLGANKKLIRTIKNYLSKGGKFYKPEDLRKIYGIGDDFYHQILPWVKIETGIKIPEKEFKKSGAEDKNINRDISVVNINTATVEELKNLPGMNESFATRIIKYRKLLGGFYSPVQISEVYGFREEQFQKVEKYLVFNSDSISRIALNFADLKTIGRHPYIGFELAKKIIAYRNKNGAFSSVDDLKQKGLISDEQQYQKIRNYLKLWN